MIPTAIDGFLSFSFLFFLFEGFPCSFPPFKTPDFNIQTLQYKSFLILAGMFQFKTKKKKKKKKKKRTTSSHVELSF